MLRIDFSPAVRSMEMSWYTAGQAGQLGAFNTTRKTPATTSAGSNTTLIEETFAADSPAAKALTPHPSESLPFTKHFTACSSAGRLPDTQVDAIVDEFDASISKNRMRASGVVAASCDNGNLTLVVWN